MNSPLVLFLTKNLSIEIMLLAILFLIFINSLSFDHISGQIYHINTETRGCSRRESAIVSSIPATKPINSRSKKVQVLDRNKNLLDRYDSIRDDSKKYNISASSLSSTYLDENKLYKNKYCFISEPFAYKNILTRQASLVQPKKELASINLEGVKPTSKPLKDSSSFSIGRHLRKEYPVVIRAKGNYLYLNDEREVFDACSGAAVACLGYNNKRVTKAINKLLNSLL
jgi:hypothetical protein